MQKESLEERLRKHPTLRARVESLIDMVEDESGQLERADDAEEFLISVGLVHALCSGLPLTRARSAGAACEDISVSFSDTKWIISSRFALSTVKASALNFSTDEVIVSRTIRSRLSDFANTGFDVCPLASGRQWFPWVHIDDVVGILRHALFHPVSGPVNAVAPECVTNAEFSRALGGALHRPAFMPTPEFALRLVFGERADVLLMSNRVVPKVALDTGYSFQFPALVPALEDLLG